MRGFIKDILESEGLTVYTAADGKQGIERVLAHRPELIILDISMPKLNGVTFCRAIRAGSSTREIPIIVVSSEHHDQLEQCIAAGADDFLAKPFDVMELIIRVRAMIRCLPIADIPARLQNYILAVRELRAVTPSLRTFSPPR
jgi:two-component system, cell cycle response regulator